MDTFGLIGLVRNRGVARLAANLLGTNGAMTVDTDANGVVDGFTKGNVGANGVFVLDGGQKITMAAVTGLGSSCYVRSTAMIAISPNTAYACSADAKLTRSTNETIELTLYWYTAGDVFISTSALAGVNPGSTFTRQAVAATSPATAAKAQVFVIIRASAAGDTGSAWFKDALLTPT